MFDRDSAQLYRFGGVRAWPSILMLAVIVCGILAAAETFAHHPGSHARRLNAAAVWLDAAYSASDACTQIESMALGVPDGATKPRDAVPVIVKLKKSGAEQACIQMISLQRSSREIFVPRGEYIIHIYFTDAEGKIVSTERVRID